MPRFRFLRENRPNDLKTDPVTTSHRAALLLKDLVPHSAYGAIGYKALPQEISTGLSRTVDDFVAGDF